MLGQGFVSGWLKRLLGRLALCFRPGSEAPGGSARGTVLTPASRSRFGFWLGSWPCLSTEGSGCPPSPIFCPPDLDPKLATHTE